MGGFFLVLEQESSVSGNKNSFLLGELKKSFFFFFEKISECFGYLS